MASFAFTPTKPAGVAFDGKNLLILSYNTSRVYSIDRFTGAPVQSFPMQPNCYHLCYVDGKVFETRNTDKHLLYCDLAGNLITDLGVVTGAASLYGIDSLGDGILVLVDYVNAEVIFVSISPLSVIRRWAIGFAGSICVTYDGKDLYVGRYDAPRRLVKFDVYGNIINSVGTLSRPNGLKFDGKYLWVANDSTDRIYCISVD